MGRLYDVRSKLLEKKLHAWMRPQEVFEGIAGSMKSFFSYKVEEDRFLAETRNNAVSQRLNRMGRSLLLYHGTNLGWDECLSR